MMTFASTACGRLNFDHRVAGGDGNADGAAEITCDATAPFTNIRTLTDLSSSMGDGGLRMSADELTAYFHSERGGAYALHTATRGALDESFSTPTSMNIVGFFPAVSSDQRTLAYDDGLDVYVTMRADTTMPFTSPPAPHSGTSTTADELQPFFSPDGTAFYFARQTGVTADLYVVALRGSQDQPLTGLNTGALEAHPVISQDGLTLYYGSRPDAGVAWDVWRATRSTTSDSFAGGSLVAELETTENESPTGISADNCRLYFESSRVVGGGMYDLYVAERTP